MASLTQLNQALSDFPELLNEGQTAEEKVIEELVSRAVLAQAARAAGFTADQALVESTLAEMIEQAGGEGGHEWLGRMSRMTEGLSDDTKIVVPKFAVDDTEIIEVDGQHFRIHVFVPAHTNTDIMIEHIESKTLFLGDNCFEGRIGRFDESASMLGNIKALTYATELSMTSYIPGHGQSGTSDISIKPYLDYLNKVKAVVEAGFEEDLEDFEIKDKASDQFVPYQSWVGFDANFGKHINSMYLEIEKGAW